MIKLITK